MTLAAELLRTLGHPVRLTLMMAIVDGEELTVSELEARTGVRQPALSQQLAILRQFDLVLTRRDGKCIHYRTNGPLLHALCGRMAPLGQLR